VANEASLSNSNIFSANIIPSVVAKCNTLPFPIKPVTIKGVEVKGVMFLHPYQVRSLKTNFSTGEWGDIQKQALSGGQITGNPIFTGAIGFKDGVVLHEEPWVPYGDNTQNLIYDPVSQTNVAGPTSLGAATTGTTDVARAIFVGAQAAAFGCGAQAGPNGSPLKIRWVEELLDANNQLRITAGMVGGMKKSRFASQDYATIVMSTWATAS
jgi:N4-gp56 family major capsid protein